MTQVLEISRFQVLSGTPASHIIGAANALNETLTSLGRLHRTLVYSEDTKRWQDIILWESEQAAQAAPEIIMQHNDAGTFFALMVPESIVMQHFKVMLIA
jgi:hypothetical protein